MGWRFHILQPLLPLEVMTLLTQRPLSLVGDDCDIPIWRLSEAEVFSTSSMRSHHMGVLVAPTVIPWRKI